MANFTHCIRDIQFAQLCSFIIYMLGKKFTWCHSGQEQERAYKSIEVPTAWSFVFIPYYDRIKYRTSR